MTTATHYEGVMSLVQMAVACAMEEAGITDLHISREALATALDRLNVRFSNGVADGMRFHVEPKRIESTDGAPLAEPTSYKPAASGANPGCPRPASCDAVQQCYGSCQPVSPADLAEQARRWRSLCDKTFGPGGHLAANIVANMEKVVELHWEMQTLTPEELTALDVCVAVIPHRGIPTKYAFETAVRAVKKLRATAETGVAANQAAKVLDYAASIAETPAPRMVDCSYCHGEGSLTKGNRKLVCPDCRGEGTIEQEAQ